MIRRALGHLILCKDVSRLVSQLQEAPPSSWQRFRLRMHLAVCDACTNLEAQIGFLRQAMRRYRE
jgi:Putative zinc-finger